MCKMLEKQLSEQDLSEQSGKSGKNIKLFYCFE